ncbi:MAG: diaminopimelate epimerase [Flavobacteriales bacterium]|nr:diaminopimelate epimerase [Flavobacteriales bacterium]
MTQHLWFQKWEGTGNDFIVVDDRAAAWGKLPDERVAALCDRHFGIGSDGLILIQPPIQTGTAFHMDFRNPDGSRSFCGNGSRCAFAFWSAMHGRVEMAAFSAIDGAHHGQWEGPEVAITIPDVTRVEQGVDGAEVDFLHTGSPHLLVWVPDVDAVDLPTDAPPRRRTARFGPGGTNVNYVQVQERVLRMRTFERGVEAETWSCGSGVVAAALGGLHRSLLSAPVKVHARGGVLRVEADRLQDGGFTGVRLIGPVRHVFSGELDL